MISIIRNSQVLTHYHLRNNLLSSHFLSLFDSDCLVSLPNPLFCVCCTADRAFSFLERHLGLDHGRHGERTEVVHPLEYS
jgi:hypothetical protein